MASAKASTSKSNTHKDFASKDFFQFHKIFYIFINLYKQIFKIRKRSLFQVAAFFSYKNDSA